MVSEQILASLLIYFSVLVMEDKDSLATGSSKDIVPSSTNVTDGDVNTSQKIDFSIAN